MSPQTYAMKTLTDGNRKKVRSPSLLVAENVLMPNRCLEAAVQCSDEPEPKPLASLNPIFPTSVLTVNNKDGQS